METLVKTRDSLHDVCRKLIGRYVRVQTILGQTHEGTIVNVDSRFVYLQVASPVVDESLCESVSPHRPGERMWVVRGIVTSQLVLKRRPKETAH